MTNSQPMSVSEARLAQALDSYLAALQAGTPPDKHEFLAHYPEVAEDLEVCLASLEFIRRAAVKPSDPLAVEDSPLGANLPTGVLGDFRILREVGRGGMGVVYEAEQISLGRRVALKVLPFAAALDARQLQRFKNEAQAAAHLHHPHIVPVHGVGCERGVHFYAMHFIEGQTLAAVIAELRGKDAGRSSNDEQRSNPQARMTNETPIGLRHSTLEILSSFELRNSACFRAVAQLGIQAAEALEYAHRQGIIHRDIKPANLLLDQQGQLWIADFGLAKLQGQGSLTMSGDVVGTLRYMSPEQALAKYAQVDERTDVYSLGATLYELLTLQPAFPGQDREELLRQIALEEPRPLRRLNPAIPAEVETIVLKAMAKNPEERYVTAQELADDLRCFLEDKPIKARRPSLRQRTAKWARRHKTVVRATLAVLLLATVGLAVGTVLIWQAKEDLKEALDRERQNGYYQRIALAEREWSANNLGRMQLLLAACPEDLRGWEWSYLQRLRFRTIPPLRHDGAVLCAVFSPDGQRIASSGREGIIRIWDAATGRMLGQIPADQDVIYGVVFSPDGRCLASGCAAGTVKLWDAETGHELSTLKGHTAAALSVAFSPDGQHLASGGGRTGEVKIWNLATGREERALGNPPINVFSVRFSPDGTLLAAGGDVPETGSGLAKVWDTWTGLERKSFRTTPLGIRSVSFSPDGKRLAAVGGVGNFDPNQEVKVWDIETGQELFSLRGHVGGLQTVAFSPDGRRLASAGIDQTIKLWDTATGREVLTLRGHLDHVFSVAFSPDGNRLVSASLDKTVRIWDASSIGSGTGEEFRTFPDHGGAVASVAFHPTDGHCLASAGTDGIVKLWDPWSGRELHSLHCAHRIAAMAFSPDGRRLVVGGKRAITVWDVTTAKEIGTNRSVVGVLSVAFNRDGGWFASSGYSRVIHRFDATTGQEVRSPLRDHNYVIHGLAFSPRDRDLLASADADSKVHLWDVQKGQELRVLEPQHAARSVCVAFSPDGALLASGSWDRTIKVWDTDSWKLLHDLHNATGAIQSVAFSPESRPQARRLAWGGTDGLVKVWDEATREEHTFRGHTGWVQSVAFSPDGKQLASASADGTVKIWNLPPLPEPAGAAAAQDR